LRFLGIILIVLRLEVSAWIFETIRFSSFLVYSDFNDYKDWIILENDFQDWLILENEFEDWIILENYLRIRSSSYLNVCHVWPTAGSGLPYGKGEEALSEPEPEPESEPEARYLVETVNKKVLQAGRFNNFFKSFK
jgi:hypothetical protein